MEEKAIITSGNIKLVYSNRICCFNNERIDIKYKLTEKKEDELKMSFIFNYSDDLKQNISIDTDTNDWIIIKLTNFNNPLGTGLKKPIQIAELNNKDIFIIFNIYKNDESNPILDFSLYMEN